MGKGGIFGFLRLGRKREPPISFAEFRGRIADEIRRRYPGVRVDDVGEDGLETWFPDCDEPGFLNLARNHAAIAKGETISPGSSSTTQRALGQEVWRRHQRPF
jgi:hypothetical protein